jgi:DNA-binding Xre family transcriptional regulator
MSTIRIHDLATDEVIDRDMTEEELAIAEVLSADSLASMAAAKAKEAVKAALLERLGITADEAALLLS